jgi:hypothetical protein
LVVGERVRSTGVPVRLTALLLAPVSLYYAVHSAFIGWTLRSPLPAWDIWVAIERYFDWVEGGGGLAKLFEFHNEHRIVTTRLLLLVDAKFFDFRGGFPVLVSYLAMLAIAVVVARVAVGPSNPVAVLVGTACLSGLVWAIAQTENLGYPFQVCFPLVHLFALLTIAAAGKALRGVTVREHYYWFIAAGVFDVLAVFSLANGTFVIGSVLLLSVLIRRCPRALIFFGLGHCLLVMVYLVGFQRPEHHRMFAPHAADYLRFLATYSGSFMNGWPWLRVAAGLVLLIAASGLTLLALWRSYRGVGIDPGAAVLLAMSGFVAAAAVVTTVARTGIEPPTIAKFVTPPLVMLACVAGAAWRLTPKRLAQVLHPTIGIVILIAVVGANAPWNELVWQYAASEHDKSALAFLNGAYPAERRATMISFPESMLTRNLARLEKRRWAIYGSDKYRPSQDVFLLTKGDLPKCRLNADVVSFGAEAFVVKGWALAPDSPHGVKWLLAYDEMGTFLGLTQPTDPRPDVAKALHAEDERTGFALYLAPDRVKGNQHVRVVASLADAGGCQFELAVPPH